MSDYTPSLAEIREYVETGGEPRPWVELDNSEKKREQWRAAAFDRMIEAVRAEEREKAAQIAEQVKPGADTDYEFQRGFYAAAAVAGIRIRGQGKEQGS